MASIDRIVIKVYYLAPLLAIGGESLGVSLWQQSPCEQSPAVPQPSTPSLVLARPIVPRPAHADSCLSS